MPANREAVAGYRIRLWGGLETTPGTGPSAAAGPAAGDAFDVDSFDAPLHQARRRVPNTDLTGYANPKLALRGAYDPIPVSLRMQLRGSGAAATPPDFGFLFRAAAMTETIGASVVYTPAETLADGATAWLWAASEGGEVGTCYGNAVFGEPMLGDLGADTARLSFSGQAGSASTVQKTLVGTGGITNVATSLPLNNAHGWTITPNCPAFIRVTEGANSEVMKVTALDTSTATDTATVTRNITGTGAFAFTISAVITAYVPTRTVSSAAPIGEHLGSFTLDEGGGAATLQAVKHSLAIRTGATLWDKEAFLDVRAGGLKEPTGEDTCVLTSDFVFTTGTAGSAKLARLMQDATDCALVLTLGSAAGNRLVVSIPDAQVHDWNATGAGTAVLRGTAVFRGYSATGAPYSLTFN